MNMYITVVLQVTGYLILIYFIFKLINTAFRIAKALEGIDETLYQIHNKLEDKNKKQNNSSNKS